MLVLALVFSFAAAALTDYVSIAWHAARERGDVVRGTGLACLIEALTWAPLALALEVGNAPALAIAAIAGVAAANAHGLRKWQK